MIHAMNKFAAAAAVFAGLFGSTLSSAQEKPANYPTRPIRIVVPSVPGGGLDIIARSVAQMLSDRWNQSVIVDNRTGAGTVIATEIGARAAPDGYTLLAHTDTLRIIGATRRVAFDVRKAFDPVVPLTAQPYILIVGAAVPAKSVKELVALSMSSPLSYGSSGIGTTAHLGFEVLTAMTGAKFVHVPYKGGAQSLLALMGGEIQMYPGLLLSATPALKSGKARALAVFSLKRIAALPELPTVAEQGFPGFKIVNSYALFAPAGTPRPILAALNKVIGEFMHSAQISQRLLAEGSQAADTITPEEFKIQFAREYDEVERQVKQLKVKLF
jgi:tripartite-type tricarboxylate transporter receptor subunit TctC